MTRLSTTCWIIITTATVKNRLPMLQFLRCLRGAWWTLVIHWVLTLSTVSQCGSLYHQQIMKTAERIVCIQFPRFWTRCTRWVSGIIRYNNHPGSYFFHPAVIWKATQTSVCVNKTEEPLLTQSCGTVDLSAAVTPALRHPNELDFLLTVARINLYKVNLYW